MRYVLHVIELDDAFIQKQSQESLFMRIGLDIVRDDSPPAQL